MEYCMICDRRTRTTISAPADTGPFTDVDESMDFTPTERWDMPMCPKHKKEHAAPVTCATCKQPVPRIDAVSNGSPFNTVNLCRPCNQKKNQ